jgi:hypothetical protein
MSLIQITRISSLLAVTTFAMARAMAMQETVRPLPTASTQSNPVATRLKVLPKDTSVQDIYKIMAAMQRDLGVQCGFCHEEDPDSKQVNYASDENPRKEIARSMMRMTNDINTKYLGQLGDRQYASPITCGSCHLGQMHPPPFDPATR